VTKAANICAAIEEEGVRMGETDGRGIAEKRRERRAEADEPAKLVFLSGIQISQSGDWTTFWEQTRPAIALRIDQVQNAEHLSAQKGKVNCALGNGITFPISQSPNSRRLSIAWGMPLSSAMPTGG
jgi:hypothetical protein